MGGGFNIVSHIKRREKVGLVEDWLVGWLVGILRLWAGVLFNANTVQKVKP